VSLDPQSTIGAAEDVIRETLREDRDRPFVLGICGAQGSGKSTLAAALAERFAGDGMIVSVLSLDDLYLTRREREALARDVHPLLLTRGVPGTHDVAFGLRLLDAIGGDRAVALPRFDKGRDDRMPRQRWGEAAAGTQLLILEGWCVGARPQLDAALADPINALEREEDADGRWRRFVNDALAGDYQSLFARIDLLMLLAAPGFEVVRSWREQQERELVEQSAGAASRAMDQAEIGRFIQHYERLTRHILAEMPERANLVAEIGEDRSLRAIRRHRA
jgi:D-glycerate 3-kinase